jgi:hypothetical protein
MKTTTQTPATQRKRKFLLILPLIILPFTTLFFWALGGGKASASDQSGKEKAGLNTSLPDARLTNKDALNKMSYYDKAAADSQKLKEQMKTDPYYKSNAVPDTAGMHFPHGDGTGMNRGFSGVNATDPAKNEALVYQKLARLQATVNQQPQQDIRPAATQITDAEASGRAEKAAEISVLRPDPELQQMNGLLEKILDIQHPERMKEKSDQPADPENKKFKAIPAVIDGNQKITQGTVVRLKLMDTVTLNGQLIPRGQLIFSSGNLYNQRLTLNIKNIRVGYTILPVDLTVFDMTDGLEGVNVPEAITGDALKDGASSGVQGVEFMSLDPSLTTQLAGAGLNTAKGLFSKKVKRVKAKLKDGHQVLLRDNKIENAHQ